jgi:hypothetical protein
MKNIRFYLLFCLFCCLSANIYAQTTRVKNEEGRWILLNTQSGSWTYEDDAPKAEPPAQSVDIPRPTVTTTVETPAQPVIKNDTPDGMRTIIVDGTPTLVPIEKTVVPPPPAPVAVPKSVDVPLPKPTSATILEQMSVPVPQDTSIIVATDSTKKATGTQGSDQVGSEFGTPEDEYRTKAAAAGATTKQDDALGSMRKKEAKKKKEEKNTAEKAPKVVEKPKKAKKTKEMPSYCNLITDEVDEFTGKEKKIGKPLTLFSFTPEAARKYMRSDDYLTCTANFSRIGSFKTLNLTIVVDSQFGQSEYGTIEDGSSLIIKMIDGSTVELVCDKGDVGRVDKIHNQTIYNVFYIVESSFERQLNGGEASRVRLVWSVGFEDYELYDVDFFTHHIKCIN